MMAYYRSHVLVCGGTPCELGGCRAVKDRLIAEIARHGLAQEIRVLETGCLGPCSQGPIIIVYPEGTIYANLTTEDVPVIVQEHLLKGRIVKNRVYTENREEVKSVVTFEPSNYFGLQERIVLRNCGRIDPDSIEEYIANEGYQALGKSVSAMQPQEVVGIIKDSGLRGRGGAGFPTGLKWSFTANTVADQKYIVCNADEGEPGTFKDRLILEGDPHSIIEGMAIAGYAVGANKGFIYIRGEYKQSIQRMQQAIEQARQWGLLGEDIFGSQFSFDLEVRSGAGAYVCGEETALLESIEGNRGEPRYKPPFPGISGLWGRPTVVNNVETLANIAPIILKGSEWFRGFGTEKCPGTKVFTMTGDIHNEGLIEVPMGISLRQIVYGVGGGIPGGLGFKMAQTGGTSGGCLPVEFLDLPMDYDTLANAGSALGSGALLIMDETHCIVDIVKCFLKFFKHESCGKCTPCREGTARLYELVHKISDGRADEADLQLLKELSQVMQVSALCGLGQAAPNPVLTCLKYFSQEFDAHLHGQCPTGDCSMNRSVSKVG